MIRNDPGPPVIYDLSPQALREKVERWRNGEDRSQPIRSLIIVQCTRCEVKYEIEAPPPELNKNGMRVRTWITAAQSRMQHHMWNKHGVLTRPENRGTCILKDEW